MQSKDVINMENTFTNALGQFDPIEIANEVKQGKGYYTIENGISHETASRIVDAVNAKDYLVNNNNVGIVYSNGMSFHSHTLTASKECYDIITNSKIRSICNNFFDGPYKLSNQRFYETRNKAHMPWHTDNNVQSGNTFMGKHNLPGILFLLYLSDVSDTNPFQFVSESYKWSSTHNERYFSDKLIEQKYANQVVTVRASKGTLIICNTHMIHRAEPFDRPGFKRFTFLFQVDARSDDHVGHGEKLLIDPAFVDDSSPDVLSYLGFGLKSNYPTFPQTSVVTMSPDQLFDLQKYILPKVIHSLLISAIKGALPSSVLIKLKNMNILKWFSKPSGSTVVTRQTEL